jgi:hypothetical protein
MSSRKSNSSNSSNNERGQQREIQEDGPEYRSVMMAPLAAPPLPSSFAAPPPAMKFARPLPSAIKIAPSKSTVPSSTKTPIWTVSEPTPLPFHYLLERTNVCVDDASAQECADRICRCLRTLNIVAQQGKDDDVEHDSSNLLLAETHDCVKFAVRLFSDQGNVVVEVQRRGGCSFGFREASRAVLSSVKGAPPMALPKRQFTIPVALPPRSSDVLEECVGDDFEIAMNMLRSEGFDSKMLALDSLEQMTKSCGSIQVAAKLVLGCECVERLVDLLEEQDDANVSTRKVLAIVANACAALNTVDLEEILSTSEHLKTASFLSCLLSSMKEASERPHDAYQAARCLKSLLISKDVENAIAQMSCIEVVELACSAGCNCHHALEQESQKLMTQLRNVCC